jgi:hypothetical protein
MNMLKYILSAIIAWTILTGCKKYNEAKNDASGDLYLRGRIFYNDNISTNGNIIPLGKIPVKIGYPSDNGINYLYITSADDNGYFIFKHLTAGKEYLIFADSSVSSIRFSGKRNITLPASLDTAALVLEPDQEQQNGLIYTVKDSLGGIIKDCDVCIFSNVFASNDTCLGSTWQIKTNDYGKANKLNIPAGTYISHLRASVLNLRLGITDTISISIKGIQRKEVVLKRR